ncbi:hypothetical protein BDV23DRAFT_116609 [Aspergillus alliaceus]|uniref:BZIP domain-containing protein n=1 Tax=Petromyces alliaceus TaxID=209559 RepID=A0A5N7CNL5_PETAA|nr:hypothetical protein BDV23DRAFT_116609 [Aspergillus alliaceus]
MEPETKRRARRQQKAISQKSEKRRHQLRLAQRAYRDRKEQTILALQARTKELEEGIDKLSQKFITFSGMLLETDLKHDPDVMSNLHHVNQVFVSLAKVRSDGKSPPEMDLAGEESPSTEMEKPASTPVSTNPGSPAAQGQSSIQDEITAPPTLITNLITISSMPILTFAQHLVRKCTQNAYLLLTRMPNHVTKLNEVFGYQLTSDDKTLLICLFQNALQDVNTIELRTHALSTLRNVNSPIRREDQSKLPCMSNPGDWLDAHGVLGFLNMKGVPIQGDVPVYPVPDLHYSMPDSSRFNLIKFIEVVAKTCRCIGAGPAFQRHNVETAFRLATLGGGLCK